MSLGAAARELAEEFRKTAEELDRFTDKVNVTRLLGSLASVAGSTIAVIGGLSIILTEGATLPIVVAARYAARVATVGSTLSSGASIVGAYITGKTMARLEEKFQKFLKLYKASDYTAVVIETCEAVVTCFHRTMEHLNVERSLKKALTATVCKTCGQNIASAKAASTLLKAAAKDFLFSNALRAGMSMYEFVDSAVALSKKSGCPAGELLRKYADDLEKLAKQTEEGG